MKMYFSPFVLLESASIVMTVSQLGELGFNPEMAVLFSEWLKDNGEAVAFLYPNFPEGVPPEFNQNDPNTWKYLLPFADDDDPFEP